MASDMEVLMDHFDKERIPYKLAEVNCYVEMNTGLVVLRKDHAPLARCIKASGKTWLFDAQGRIFMGLPESERW